MRRFTSVAAAVLAMPLLAVAAVQLPAGPVIPVGTKIEAALRSSLNTARTKPGDRVQAVTTADVKVHGQKLLRRGSHLLGSVLAVTPAESPKSPAHIAILFTQARTKKGQILALSAVITRIQRVAPPQPPPPPIMGPPMQRPAQDGEAPQLDRSGATLGQMAMPTQITGTDQTMNSIVSTSRQAPIAIKVQRGTASVLTARGNFKLEDGTQLQLQVTRSSIGDHPGAGNQ